MPKRKTNRLAWSEVKPAIANLDKKQLLKLVGDPTGEAELMVFFAECGNKFMVEYGDIDEGFYDALNRMYQRAIEKVQSLPEEHRQKFQD